MSFESFESIHFSFRHVFMQSGTCAFIFIENFQIKFLKRKLNASLKISINMTQIYKDLAIIFYKDIFP